MCKGSTIGDVGEGVEGHRISGDTTGRALVLKPAISLKKSWGGGATVERLQQLKNLESLETKVNRVRRRWYDVLSVYTCKIVYRPRRLNGNANLISRLPLPATKDALDAKLRLTDPTDFGVYVIGASRVQASVEESGGKSLGWAGTAGGRPF